MKLYHGSNMRVEKPDLQRSKPFKDFGQGFYLSDNYKQAEDLAIVKVEQMRRGEAIVNEFDFDESMLSSGELSVKIFDDYSEECFRNRKSPSKTQSFMTRLNPEQIKIMKDELTVELADWLMSTYGYSPSEALDVLYTSETFERLQDTATGFYFQSVGYVSSFLKNEVENATFS